jgi:NAD(P)-dependent dehydrogenase (short-subunit alcohol dehydrogenase family)
MAVSNAVAASSSRPWKVVWITGGGTGIGREVALKLAQAGCQVAISARTGQTLRDVAALHPNVHVFPLDVTDPAQTVLTLDAIETTLGPVDLALFNAGVWDPMGASDYTSQRAALSMQVNYGGVCNGVAAIVPRFRTRARGHLALVASVAGYRGLPQAAAYAPSKAAVIALAEVLRPELARIGVTVSVINPGFVKTPMTDVNTFPMPFLVTSDVAAEAIIAGLAKQKFEIAFPWQLVAIMKVLRVLPYGLFFWISSRMQPKKSAK